MAPYSPRDNPELMRHIARRSLQWGFTGKSEEVVLTAGALEALNLCLRAVTRPGDLVAIESATLYGVRSALQRFGMRPIEIAANPLDGIGLGGVSTELMHQRNRHGGV